MTIYVMVLSAQSTQMGWRINSWDAID